MLARQQKLLKFLSALLLLAPLSGAMPSSSRAANDTLLPAHATGQTVDPCLFYRSQARLRGLGHFTQSMLRSCEASEAGMHLSDRLAAAEAALEACRAGIILSGVSEEEKPAIAERSGALGAMDALDTGCKAFTASRSADAGEARARRAR
ncbi:hypothetical protein [Rhodobacteraceae bacterium DSL-40]|uniref:hypothetical protein n=1 Tax=Amaricoccus sp. B4 TaxID=3368557 RepID=UPI000DAE891A